jgi:hypothetical protein
MGRYDHAAVDRIWNFHRYSQLLMFFFYISIFDLFQDGCIILYIYNYMYKLFVVYVIFILSIYWIISIIFKGNTQLFSGLLSPIVGVNDSHQGETW